MNHKGTAQRLLKKIEQLDSELMDLLPLAFPVGSEVSYQHGESLRCATVVDHGIGRLRVVGQTEKPYWVGLYRVMDAMEQWEEWGD